MSDSYIIEVGSSSAGIVVRNPEGFRFFAASHRFNRLEGQVFRNAREAERAARRLASGDDQPAAARSQPLLRSNRGVALNRNRLSGGQNRFNADTPR